MVARLLAPQAISASRLSAETGIAQATLSRWLQAAAKMEVMPKRSGTTARSSTRDTPSSTDRRRPRTGAEKLAIVARAEGLEGEALGEFLRTEGVHLAELEQWRELAEQALQGQPAKRLAPSKEMRALKAELARKEKALAEAAALLVLKKKLADLWGDADDDTDGTSDT